MTMAKAPQVIKLEFTTIPQVFHKGNEMEWNPNWLGITHEPKNFPNNNFNLKKNKIRCNLNQKMYGGEKKIIKAIAHEALGHAQQYLIKKR